ncbi:MAG: hypothetical protein IPM29_31400 [Planctomycetes bacterium]|nr:hypothetical protein [Planctomycetota bacterium]
MKSAFLPLATAALLAAPVLAQVAIPPHATVYNGYSRGYNFTANTRFIIAQLGLPPDAMQAGDTASYMVRVNGVEVLRSVGNAGNISTSILVNVGDVVDVIGNWSPVATTSFTAHNSYGNGPFATTIEGVPHTITRTGWQWDIGDPSYLSGSYLAPTTGQLGRVLMWTAPPQGFASAIPFGTGCGGGTPASFYELFDGAANINDLSNFVGFTALWTGSTYVITPGATPIVPPTAGQLTLTDDQTVQVPLPWQLPTASGPVNSVSVCSNGWVGLQPTTTTTYTESGAALVTFAVPIIACLWDDLNPAAGGAVYAAVDPTNPQLFHITWDMVPEFSVGGANTFQLSLNAGGGWELKFGALSLADGLVGYSPGGGVRDPGSIDLTNLTPFILGNDAPPLSLGSLARPVLGQTAQVQIRDIATGSLAGVVNYGVELPTPIDLTPIGATGCLYYVGRLAGAGFPITGTVATQSLPLPNTPSFAGIRLGLQAVVLSPGVNALGVAASNGLRWTLDVN